jgi:glycosyltransferase involved in cell wall biosynthesis
MKNIIKRFRSGESLIHIISLSCNTVPPKAYGGIERIIATLCKGLSELGEKIICYSPGDLNIKSVEHLKTLNTPSLSAKQGGKANTVEHLELAISALRDKCSRGDVIIFNHPEQFRYAKKRIGLLLGSMVNIYEIAHTIDAGVYRNVIYPSFALRAQIKKPGCVIPHGLDLKFGNPSFSRGRDLFYAGSIDPDKGVHIALEACLKIGCKLIVAGPRSYHKYEEEIINHPVCVYIGELTQNELFDHYQKHKAFVYLTQINEPFGLVVIDAMAAGCPVITSGKGGTGETVINNKTGIIARNIEEVMLAYKKINFLNLEDCINRAKDFTYLSMCTKYQSLFLGQYH